LIEPDDSIADCANSDAELVNGTFASIEFELDEEGEVNLDFGFGMQVDETPGIRLVALATPPRSEHFIISQQSDFPIFQQVEIAGDEEPDSLFFPNLPSFTFVFTLERLTVSDVNYEIVAIDCESFGDNSTTFSPFPPDVGITYFAGDIVVCTWIVEESGFSPTAPPTFDPVLFSTRLISSSCVYFFFFSQF